MFVMFNIFESIKQRIPLFTWHGLAILLMFFFMLYPQQAFSQSGFQDPLRSSGRGGGDLVPVDANIDGGKIKLNSATQVVVLFRNDSGRPITTGAIQLYPSSSAIGSVSLNQCTAVPLPPGAVCAVAVSVKALQDGPWRMELLMRHNGRSQLVTATLLGDVEAADGQDVDKFLSDIEAIPAELDFGSLSTSQPIIRAIVLRNTTSSIIDINTVYIEAAEQSGYSLDTDCATLDAGQACIVVLRWSPILKGQATGVLLIEHSGPTSIANVNLEGNYTPDSVGAADVFPEAVPGKGLLVSSQNSVDFGADIKSISTITVSLVNVGDAALVINNISLAGSGTGLSVGQGGCGEETVLEPVEACPLTISWSPLREGSIIDDIQILHNGARGLLVLPVKGTSSAAISQDKKAVRLVSSTDLSSSREGVDSDDDDDDIVVVNDPNIDPTGVLDGFVVTSLAATKAIISGPGGSRIVFEGEEVVLGGFLWDIRIRSSGVVFKSGNDKVLLLFDRSLSSFNTSGGKSSSSSSGRTVATAGNAAVAPIAALGQ